MSSHRIESLSVAPTLERQTPRNSFGEVLLRTATRAVSAGEALASGITMGHPVLSAAVSGVRQVAALASSGVVPMTGSQARLEADPLPSDAMGGDAWALLRAQGDQSKEYLALQNEMQRESREFNALSNVLKVRHDSAKAAINNIR